MRWSKQSTAFPARLSATATSGLQPGAAMVRKQLEVRRQAWAKAAVRKLRRSSTWPWPCGGRARTDRSGNRTCRPPAALFRSTPGHRKPVNRRLAAQPLSGKPVGSHTDPAQAGPGGARLPEINSTTLFLTLSSGKQSLVFASPPPRSRNMGVFTHRRHSQFHRTGTERIPDRSSGERWCRRPFPFECAPR